MTTTATTKHHKQANHKTIAVLSDVHGNLPALEAVLADASKQHADVYWSLGDFLGYGPYVNEVVDRLYEVCAAQVIGNYDLKVLKFPKKQKKWQKTKKKEKYIAFQWAWKKLSKKNVQRLAHLPQQNIQIVDGVSFLLTHGGPEAVDEAIGTLTSTQRLKELAAMTDADVILSGHTHLPLIKTVDWTTFINPGSVGRPEGRDPRACYALLKISSNGLNVRIQKVPYNLERLSRAVHAAGLPEEFSEMFKSGKNLDQVQESHNQSVDIKQTDNEQKIAKIRRFAEQCRYERGHSEHVLKLSVILFEKLRPIHKLNAHALYQLTCAAILHDIGWIHGQQVHHKTAMRMILEDRRMPLDETDRKMVALIARYHRKALPESDHAVYCDLTAAQQKQVQLLGGILRIADGLDRSHMSAVQDMDVQMSDQVIEVRCVVRGPASAEMMAVGKKAKLFEKAAGLRLQFKPAEKS